MRHAYIDKLHATAMWPDVIGQVSLERTDGTVLLILAVPPPSLVNPNGVMTWDPDYPIITEHGGIRLVCTNAYGYVEWRELPASHPVATEPLTPLDSAPLGTPPRA